MMFETSFDMSYSMTISAGIPELTKMNNTTTWKLGLKHTTTKEVNHLETETETIPVHVQPRTRLMGQFDWKEGIVNKLPFIALYLVTFKDNTNHIFRFEGYFDETTASDFNGR